MNMLFDLSKPYCHYFNEIAKLPHASRHEKALSDYLVNFAKDHGYRYLQDEVWNVVIYKPASPGYEDHPALILQAHMDMVAERVEGSTHDFDHDPLELYVEGTYLRARGTTLGADDGMGCAYMLAILADDTLPHPPLECCFTTQEEVGLVGAAALKAEYFTARRLINLDGSGEDRTWMSTGGGQQYRIRRQLTWLPNAKPAYELKIDGLLGGHSSTMIDKEHGNAGKLMARLLQHLRRSGIAFDLALLEGGTKHNVIMMSTRAIIATDAAQDTLTQAVAACARAFQEELEYSDPGVQVQVTPAVAEQVVTEADQEAVMGLLYLLPYGLLARNMDVDGHPPLTSCNIGVMGMDRDAYTVTVSARSALECSLTELMERCRYLAGLFGGELTCDGYYPAWKYEKHSPIRETMKTVFRSMYGRELTCLTGHGGNEAGMFKAMHPDMDIVLYGPINGNIHSTREYLDLESFDRAWLFLTTFIAAL